MITTMDEFIVRALIGGLMVAAVAGPLGSFVVWRRMAYFGDTLAHSALLGVALGFLIGISTNITVIVLCVVLAMVLVLLQGQRRLASDTLLGILAHSSLSLGLVVLSFMEGLRVDLFAYLFGDILAVTWGDVGWMLVGGSVALVLLLVLWRPLLAITVHEDLARVEGQPAQWISLGFMLLIALVIAVAMKVVGILLITSLLIIPAATARRFAHTPEQMAVFAGVFGMLAVLMGVGGSLHWDTPTGPSIVVAGALLFAAVLLIPRRA